jgi:hydrogenase maturation protease
MSKDVLVLGLGNTLLADDGVGVHVVRRLAADAALPAWVRAVDGGTMGFRLTAMLSGAGDVLIIDAADIGLAPGTIRMLDETTLDAHVANGKRTSAHEAGLADLLCLARLENFGPRHLAVLAIQPQVIDWRETLSDSVENAVAPACAMATTTIMDWHNRA